MELSRREYWSGLPFSSLGDLPDAGDQIQVSCVASRFFTVWATREALVLYRTNKSWYFINFIYGRVYLLIPNSSFILKLCLWHSFYPLAISGFLNFLSQGIYCFFAAFLELFSWVFWIRLLFSRSTVFSCLRPHGLQHTRLPCPSPSPRVCSNSRLLLQWCHPTISFSVVSFSSCPQPFPASQSFPTDCNLVLRSFILLRKTPLTLKNCIIHHACCAVHLTISSPFYNQLYLHTIRFKYMCGINKRKKQMWLGWEKGKEQTRQESGQGHR